MIKMIAGRMSGEYLRSQQVNFVHRILKVIAEEQPLSRRTIAAGSPRLMCLPET